MNAWMSFAMVSVLGFAIGLMGSGYWKKPKQAPVSFVITFKKTKYHIHHWISSGVAIIVILCLAWWDVVNLHTPPIKYLTAFFSGFGVQGLMCKDAFKVKGYDRYQAWRVYMKKRYMAEKRNFQKAYAANKKQFKQSYAWNKNRIEGRFQR